MRLALFEPPAPGYAEATKQRCRSFALLLRELESEPEAAVSNGAFMQAVWDDFLADPAGEGALRRTVAQWAALAAKDWWQESLSSVWSHFLRVAGLRGDGLSPDDLATVISTELVPAGSIQILGRAVEVGPEISTATLADAVAKGTADIHTCSGTPARVSYSSAPAISP